jgi:hypothetical protein
MELKIRHGQPNAYKYVFPVSSLHCQNQLMCFPTEDLHIEFAFAGEPEQSVAFTNAQDVHEFSAEGNLRYWLGVQSGSSILRTGLQAIMWGTE